MLIYDPGSEYPTLAFIEISCVQSAEYISVKQKRTHNVLKLETYAKIPDGIARRITSIPLHDGSGFRNTKQLLSDSFSQG